VNSRNPLESKSDFPQCVSDVAPGPVEPEFHWGRRTSTSRFFLLEYRLAITTVYV